MAEATSYQCVRVSHTEMPDSAEFLAEVLPGYSQT